MVAAHVLGRRRPGVRGPDPAVGLPSPAGSPARARHRMRRGSGRAPHRPARRRRRGPRPDPVAGCRRRTGGPADPATHGPAPRRCRAATTPSMRSWYASRSSTSSSSSSRSTKSHAVLEPGGLFVLLLAHPLLQAPSSGWVDDESSGEHYWRIGGYLDDHAEVDEVAPGVKLRFVHRPAQPLCARDASSRLAHRRHGGAVTASGIARCTLWQFPEAATIPRILLLRARC